MGNGLGGLMGQAMQGGLGNIMGSMMGGAPQQQAANPMGGLMGGMLGNLFGGLLGGGKSAPAPAPDPMAAGLDMLKGMFNSGQQVQQTQMDAFQSIFEQFSGRR
jgi:hypothetical protein